MKRITLAAIALSAILSAGADTVNDAVSAVKKHHYPDSRQAILEVSSSKDADGRTVVRGVTSEQRAHDLLFEALGKAGVDYIDSLTVYPSDSTALVCIPVVTLRTRGAHAAETATQAVMGTPVRLLEYKGGWWRVQTPDGYIAWSPDSSVQPVSKERAHDWRSSDKRYVVKNLWQTRAYTTPAATGPRDVVTDLVLGAIVEADPTTQSNGRIEITLPDGRRGWADINALQPIAEWADQPFDAQKILDTAYSLEGSPYLWGGTSVKSVDCSGLVKVSYLNNGLILRRDASQQALTGKRMDGMATDSFRAADLLFFGNKDTGRVTHVGLYDSNARYVHSSGRVKRNSLDPKSPDYLYSPMSATRIDGAQGTDGIVRAIEHPWYFNLNK
ncbi:MAG: C40 family peptidase [Muribaculaceae bacterium]|nr:C40 family peptidase [Muribaculaceae bacterium]